MIIDQTRPAYRILTPAPKGFFGPDDNLYREGECIYFDGEPNEEMEPLNELAYKNMEKFLDKLDTLARAVAEKLGRPYVGRPRSLDGAYELASAVQKADLPVMGVKKDNTNIKKIEESEETPQTGASLAPRRGPGRPPKTKGTLAIEANTDQGPTSIKSVA